LKFAVLAAIAVTVFGFIVMGMWNWLAPAIFGWHAISFAQALGLLVLSRILFGGFRGHGGHRGWHWRRRLIDRWEQMTPEERERFRQGMHHGCEARATGPRL
jgi:hypothetical protein